jgi:hypothetical protein
LTGLQELSDETNMESKLCCATQALIHRQQVRQVEDPPLAVVLLLDAPDDRQQLTQPNFT